MTLKEAVELAKECGLNTIGEALMNVDIHATNLFDYAGIGAELDELYGEAAGLEDHMTLTEWENRDA